MIKAAAIKCKHCGEFLDDLDEGASDEDLDEEYDEEDVHDDENKGPVWRFRRFSWHCIAHDRSGCQICMQEVEPPLDQRWFVNGYVYPNKNFEAILAKRLSSRVVPKADREAQYQGRRGKREKLSEVGDTSDGILKCPRCAGTNFTAKRSTTGKIVGFSTLGVGGLIAPKSRVKCVTCGLMFKRG